MYKCIILSIVADPRKDSCEHSHTPPKVEFIPSGKYGFVTDLRDENYSLRRPMAIGKYGHLSGDVSLIVEGLLTGDRPDRLFNPLYGYGSNVDEAAEALKCLLLGYHKDLIPVYKGKLAGDALNMALFLRNHIKRSATPRRVAAGEAYNLRS
jgi:hypothetical protein